MRLRGQVPTGAEGCRRQCGPPGVTTRERPHTGDRLPDSMPWHRWLEYPSEWRAMWDTIKVVALDPSRAFFNVEVKGSGIAATDFMAAVFLPLGMVRVSGWLAFGLLLGALGRFSLPDTVLVPAIILLALPVYAASLVVFEWLVSHLYAAAFHLALKIVKAGPGAFEGTYCVVAYARGSTAPLVLVPIVGRLVCLAWRVHIWVIGLAQVHRIPESKAAAAVIASLCVLLLPAAGLVGVLLLLAIA
ncbi:MAG: YIP1 family protein [Candidatus Brocadiia bacterium]|nr:YIP1 family protein [Candidatus Brocadiia bacterium]